MMSFGSSRTDSRREPNQPMFISFAASTGKRLSTASRRTRSPKQKVSEFDEMTLLSRAVKTRLLLFITSHHIVKPRMKFRLDFSLSLFLVRPLLLLLLYI
jgi:hypothetical protein